MAGGIELPPWLTPQAAIGWGQLAARGQQLQLERARIQQSGINANMEAQARRESQQAEDNRQQQQIQYQKAYHDAEMGLRQQQLDQSQQAFQQQVKDAATKSAAMMRISQRIAAGDDPSKVFMEEGPAAGATADAMMRTANRPGAFIPKTVTMNEGTKMIETSAGHWKSAGNIYDPAKTKPTKPTLDTNTPAKIIYDEDGNPTGKAFKMSDGSSVLRALTQDDRDAIAKSEKNKPKQPSESDIAYLKKNPDSKAKFEKEFGSGSADDILSPPTEAETP